MPLRTVLAVAALAGLSAVRLAAQCPDGTPPPCRGSTSAVASATRRPSPPLDERTWIVLPFENIARVQDIDWLMDASVNLLYLDMSKWRDIRVIDDERVADLIREVPEARAGLTLQSGLAVARRAGAGTLVMGDLLKVGSRTQIVAKVFDVRTGQRVRNVREETSHPDSLMSLFGRLARGILAADPPTGAALGTGTTSLVAYQEYLAGVTALNSFAIQQAQQRFTRALQADSSFALAHYKLSIVLGWSDPTSRARRTHADAAARLGGGLPARERTLIAAQAQSAANDYGRACETLTPLVRADSSDIEALYNLGECAYHDIGVVPLPGDSSRFMFRTSWNTALWAFRRVLELDATYHLAFQHIQDAFQSNQRTGCLVSEGRPRCVDQTAAFAAALRRSGDSLLMVPERQGSDALAVQAAEAQRSGARRRNLDEARRAAEAWLSAGPAEPRAGMAYGRALLRLGRLEEAQAALRQVSGSHATPLEAAQYFLDRIEIAIKLNRSGDAGRLLDSIRSAVDTVRALQGAIGLASATLGRPGKLDSMIRAVVTAPPWVHDYFIAGSRTALGLTVDSLPARERVFAERAAGQVGARGVATLLVPSLVWGMRSRGTDQWPAHDTASADRRIALVSWLAVGDTTRFRRALASFDSVLLAAREDADAGTALLSAEAHLVLRDSNTALQRLLFFRDVTWRHTPLADAISQGFATTGMLWPRTFLLLGDLAAARGDRQVATDGYRRFIGMWEHGEAEVRPAVQRAREALARLGP